MSDPAPKTPLTAKSALDLLKEWKELIAFIALTLTSLLTAVVGQNKPYVPLISFIFAVVFVSVGTWIVHQKRQRNLAKERATQVAARHEQSGMPQVAFRSLASFEERDKLPGKSRRLEARLIATVVASDNFKFGIVCGDSGCGKTSMLQSEVTQSLQKLGFEVSHVRNPRQLESKVYPQGKYTRSVIPVDAPDPRPLSHGRALPQKSHQ